MPRTSRPAAYSPEYELLLTAASTKGCITVYCGTLSKVHQLRSKLYSYFTSLRKAGERLDLIKMADSLHLIPADGGLSLEITLKAQSWDSLAIKAALGLQTGPEGTLTPEQHPAPEQPHKMVELLKAIRAEEAAGK